MGKHGRHGRVTGTAKNKGQAKMKKKIVKMRSDGGRTQLKHDRKAGIPSGRGISGSSCSGNGGAPKGMEYSASQSILPLGEGDFSFAAALAIKFGECKNVVATAFDDEATVDAKYTGAAENVETVRSLGGEVLYSVDATRLSSSVSVRRAASRCRFDRIVFNFPHTGSGIKDEARNIAANQALLRGLFSSVATSGLLSGAGELHLTLKRGRPYDAWQPVVLAKLAGWRVRNCVEFNAAKFVGYAHRRTIGDEHAGEGEVTSGKTYAFVPQTPREAVVEVQSERGKILPTGQTYKDAWKQRHKKARRP